MSARDVESLRKEAAECARWAADEMSWARTSVALGHGENAWRHAENAAKYWGWALDAMRTVVRARRELGTTTNTTRAA